MIPEHILCRAYGQAAQAKGRALSDTERAEVYAAVDKDYQRASLRERFLNVIRMAGYKGGAPEAICNRWLDTYMAEVPKFVAMLETYEAANCDRANYFEDLS